MILISYFIQQERAGNFIMKKYNTKWICLALMFVSFALLIVGCGSSSSSQPPITAEPQSIFYIDLYDSIYDFNGEYIETIIPIDESYSDDEIRAEEGLAYCLNALFSKDLTEKERASKYVKIRGIVSADANGNYWNRYNIKNCEAVSFYNEAPADFQKSLDEYNAKIEEKNAMEAAQLEAELIQQREEFFEKAESVSYEELRRYPDTYSGKELELSVTITEVKTDDWLFNGAILAEYEGQEIVISDERTTREPRFLEGDIVTIYAEGGGLTKIKTVLKGSGLFGSDLGAETKDEREVPLLIMLYTEFDKTDDILEGTS